MDLRLQIRNKCQNIKTLKRAGSENLMESKFIGSKAAVDPRNINLNLTLRY